MERMCLEKGLHRRETLQQPAILAEGKERILRLFWSIYVLDMRWSFGTGMPFALEDTDIDPWLPVEVHISFQQHERDQEGRNELFRLAGPTVGCCNT